MEQFLDSLLVENGQLKQEILEKIELYVSLINYWNKRFNLVGKNEPSRIIERHFFDSFCVLKYYTLYGEILDFGTGAGFPGIPLAIVRKDLRFTLNDINEKKVIFLKKVKFKLNLDNVEILKGDFLNLEISKFDFLISRAVTKIDIISDKILQKMKIGGKIIFMKSEKLSEAENIWLSKKSKITEIIDYEDYNGNLRKLVILKKIVD